MVTIAPGRRIQQSEPGHFFQHPDEEYRDKVVGCLEFHASSWGYRWNVPKTIASGFDSARCIMSSKSSDTAGLSVRSESGSSPSTPITVEIHCASDCLSFFTELHCVT